MVNIVKMCTLTNQDIFLKSLKTLLFCLRDFRLKSSYYLFLLPFQINQPLRAKTSQRDHNSFTPSRESSTDLCPGIIIP